MHTRSNTLVITLCVALFTFLTIPLLPSFAKKAEAKEPYKVGAVFAVTGRASFLGEPEKKTVEMIAEEINAAGGINGHPLELIVYDDEGDATKCNVAMKKLISACKTQCESFL